MNSSFKRINIFFKPSSTAPNNLQGDTQLNQQGNATSSKLGTQEIMATTILDDGRILDLRYLKMPKNPSKSEGSSRSMTPDNSDHTTTSRMHFSEKKQNQHQGTTTQLDFDNQSSITPNKKQSSEPISMRFLTMPKKIPHFKDEPTNQNTRSDSESNLSMP
jgi:lipopolysaccharide export LptBFGC system permease protein LptF